MTKRPTQKPANTQGENGAGKPADTPNQLPPGADQGGGEAGGGGSSASPAPNTERGDAEQSAGAPMAAPGGPGQEHTGRGVDGDAGAPAGSPQNPTMATAPETPVTGDGGRPEDGDRKALEDAVAAITGDITPFISEGVTLEILPSGYQVWVTGPKRGRRRIGRDFGREPVSIPIEELAEEDLAALQADPSLTVEVIKVDIPGRDAGGQPGETGASQ